MGKRNTKISRDTQPLFSRHKSYSVAEIMAAGGTTAFANKLGKHPQFIGERLEKLPEDAFLTDDEATRALEMLNARK